MTTAEIIALSISCATLIIGGGGFVGFLMYRANKEQALASAREANANATKTELEVAKDAAVDADAADAKARAALSSSYETRLATVDGRMAELEKSMKALFEENLSFKQHIFELNTLIDRLLDVIYEIMRTSNNVSAAIQCRVEEIRADVIRIRKTIK